MKILSSDEINRTIKNIETYGYCVLPGLLSKDETLKLKKRTVELHAGISKKIDYQGRPSRDLRDKMVYNLQAKDKSFIDLLDSSELKLILKHFLNDPYYRFLPPEAPNYNLSYYNARSSGEKLDLHIDSHIPYLSEKIFAMQAVFVLDDFHAGNGCTVVAPGSHRSGKFTDRSLSFDDLKKVEANAGDFVLWDSRIWHGTTENITGEDRWALIATLVSWWVKPSMDMARSLPQEIYEKLTLDQKVLLGFCAIPPVDEYKRINTKRGFEDLSIDVKEMLHS